MKVPGSEHQRATHPQGDGVSQPRFYASSALQSAHSTCFGARREMPVGAEERVRLELPLRGRAVTCRLVEAKATIDVLPAIRDTYVDSQQLAPTPKNTL